MRDKIMPKQYFDKYIDKRTEMLLKYNAAFEKGEVKEERVKPVKYAMSLIEEYMLLEFLACTYIGEEFDNNIKLLFKKDYEKFKDFIENSRNPSDLKQILKKGWYNSRRENYDSHNRSDYTYCGYWSFEAGAIVKLLGIDDTILKDMKYYPYDLVHYKEERDGIIQ